MPAMSVGGLASGLDTNSIIAQLTALEQAKVTREIKKKESAQSTLDKFKELETRLGNLQQKAKTLELPKDFNVFKASSNYEEYASISGGEGATAGQYELKINQLATTQKVASNSFEAVNKSMIDCSVMDGSDEPVTISLSLSEAAKKNNPKKDSVEIKINASDTLKDIVNKINAAEGSGVKASIMSLSNGENRIVLTAVDTGTNGFFLKEDGGTNLLGKLGIVDYSDQKATSGNALTIKGGGPATEENTFKDLNTVLNSNNLDPGDKIGIYLPKNDGSGSAGWKTFELFNAGNPRTIGDVLNEINEALEDSGANFEASLNKSGEIVLKGKLNDDQNFGNLWLSEVKIQMGTFANGQDTAITTVKKDMGSLTNRNIFTNVINEGQNAFYTIDGMSISSQSNSDDKTIVGTTFTLKKVSVGKLDEPIKVSLEPDMSALAEKIGAFVEEFNALLKFIDENSKATIKEDTDKETGKKTNQRVVGAFTGESSISTLRDNLRQMFSGTINEITGLLGNGYSTVYSSVSRLGIITNKEGYFEVDKEKLTKALNADFEGVRKLFTSGSFSDTAGFSVGHFTKDSQGGVYEYNSATLTWTLNGKEVEGTWFENSIFTTKNGLSFELPAGAGDAKVTFVRGIAGQLSNFVEKAKSGYYSEIMGKFVDGYFKQSKDKYQERIDEIQKRVDQLQLRVDNYNSRLVKQFASLEKSMSNLQAQSANMMSALSGISYKK
jgi:flagellar hook-associated protein 2